MMASIARRPHRSHDRRGFLNYVKTGEFTRLDALARKGTIEALPSPLGGLWVKVEFQLLQILAEHPGHIFSRSRLMDRIYPDRRVVSDRAIDSHVKKLRKKIAVVSPGEDWIRSVYSVGYKLKIP